MKAKVSYSCNGVQVASTEENFEVKNHHPTTYESNFAICFADVTQVPSAKKNQFVTAKIEW